MLAIAGLIIGGIWYAAAAVQNNRKLTRSVESTIQIINGASAAFKGFTIPWDGLSLSDDTTSADSNISSYGFIPKDLISGNNLVDPWGNPLGVSFAGSGSANGDKSITITFTGVSKANCIHLLNRMFGSAFKMFDPQAWIQAWHWPSSTKYLDYAIAWGKPTTLFGASNCADNVHIYFTFARDVR